MLGAMEYGFFNADAQTALVFPAGNVGADNLSVLSFGIHVSYGNFGRQTAFKRLNDARAVMHTQYAHDILMSMRQHFRDNHMVASNALRQNRISKKRAACVFLCAGKRRAVLRFHADHAARHAANGQLNSLFFLCAHFANRRRGALSRLFCSHAGLMISIACIAFHIFLSCF